MILLFLLTLASSVASWSLGYAAGRYSRLRLVRTNVAREMEEISRILGDNQKP